MRDAIQIQSRQRDEPCMGCQQHSSAMRFSVADGVITCWMDFGHYFVRFILTIAFGLSFTLVALTALDESIWLFLLLLLVAGIGWVSALSYLLYRQRVLIDFAHERIVLDSWTAYVSARRRSIAFEHVVRFIANSVVYDEDLGLYASREPRPDDRTWSHRLAVEMTNGRVVNLLETASYERMTQLVDAIARESGGRFEVARSIQPQPGGDPNPPAAWRTIFAVLLALMGTLMFIVNVIEIGRTLMQRRWPTTPGTMVQSRVWRDHSIHQNSDGGWTIEPATQALARIRFELNGATYEPTIKSRRKRIALARAYPSGSPVRVSYNPKTPADATVDPAIGSMTIAGIVAGAAAVLPLARLVKRRTRLRMMEAAQT